MNWRERFQFIKDLQTVALRDVIKEDVDYQLRLAFRWYARTYGLTPLEAEQLPLEHVLKEFFEDKYAHMSPEERDQEMAVLLETDEERVKRMMAEAQASTADNDFDKMTLDAIAAQNKKAEAAPITPAVPPVAAPIKPMKEVELEGAGKQVTRRPKVLPGINMKFELPKDMEEIDQNIHSLGGNLSKK